MKYNYQIDQLRSKGTYKEIITEPKRIKSISFIQTDITYVEKKQT